MRSVTNTRTADTIIIISIFLALFLFPNSGHCQLKDLDAAEYRRFFSGGGHAVKYTSGAGAVQDSKTFGRRSKVDKLGKVFKERVEALRTAPNGEVELVFLVDSSASVGVQNYYNELKFVKKLLADFTVACDYARVAVITFSSRTLVLRVVDHLTNATSRNNKCRLLNEEMPRIGYTGGGTFTYGAIVEAQRVFEASRPNASKALFLVTDGYSNGLDPRPAADRIRRSGVELFTFGIKNGNVRELLDMASEPKSQHCYILDSFDEFEALARRALHEDLHVGNYESEHNATLCSGLCLEDHRSCCDEMAKCTCGIHTGHYACVCQKGHYGTGLRGDCQPCPAGTYSDSLGPSDVSSCKSCPDVNQESIPGSAAVHDCRCRKGFRQQGHLCLDIECPKLMPPNHGYTVKSSCDNVYNAVCGFQCDNGYILNGSSVRVCSKNGEWSGEAATCIARTCPSPTKPRHGDVICTMVNFAFQSRCNFTCDVGFTLVGSQARSCLANATWDGTPSHCIPVTCPALSHLKNGTVSPTKCNAHSSQYGEFCTFSCNDGFTLIGPSKRSCIAMGVWSSTKETRCLDTEPPLLECPPDIEAQTDEKENSAVLIWKSPLTTDNSGEVPILSSIPVVVHPMKFHIGQSMVTYTAEDKAKNRVTCNFTVSIHDAEPPTVDKCASPPVFLSRNKSVSVEWDEPIFSDNSGKVVHVEKSTDSLQTFERGETEVTYTAWDESGNNSTCILTITIQEHPCPIPMDPINGHRNCSEENDGVFCSLTCEEGYAFAVRPADVYFCAYDGLWSPSNRLPFPDCAVTMLPSEALINSILTMRSESIPCKDMFFIHQVERKMHKKLSDKLMEYCVKGIDCDVAHVSAECEQFYSGAEEESNYILRKRRSIESIGNNTNMYILKEEKIAIKFQVKGKLRVGSIRLNGSSVSDDIMTFLSRLRDDAKKGELDLRMGTRQLTYRGLTLLFDGPRLVCDAGSVLRENVCVNCPVGTYYNVINEECQPCDKGSYQFAEGQLSCLVCPHNTTTSHEYSKTPGECKAQCLPGSFSTNGLEICETCNRGYYQMDYSQTACIQCPPGRTTHRRGVRRSSECRELCSRDFVSETGLAPCYPCPEGYHQPNVGQHFCYQCTIRSSDLGGLNCSDYGGAEEFQVNDCFSVPCNNGGACKPLTFGYICDCLTGFTGIHCETEIDECADSPCQNGGHCEDGLGNYTCFCSPGYEGELNYSKGLDCELEIDECRLPLCLNNGTCVDLLNDFICKCSPGFEGKTCGINIDECVSGPCLNGGTCIDVVAAHHCLCPPGLIGQFCETNLDECESGPCFNGATCVDLLGRFSCVCPPGFLGTFCETDVDDCGSQPCTDGATCVDKVDAFHCICPPAFSGLTCETELSADFVLHFSKLGITDYVVADGFRQDLAQASFCLWMRTNDRENYGTPLSYASDAIDNLFSLVDYNGFALYVNGHHVITDVTINDGRWHFVCVTWASDGGVWIMYKDGVKADSGLGLANGTLIEGGGALVIGQEQDRLGGAFSDSESFIGQITRLDFWDHVLTSAEVSEMVSTCDQRRGSIRAWPDFLAGIKGRVRIEDFTFCKGCPHPVSIANGRVFVEGNLTKAVASYKCDLGYSLKPDNVEHRRCLVSGDWSGNSPNCKRNSCGFPGYVANGYIQATGYFYKDVIHYKCNSGYKLFGNDGRMCLANGQWKGQPPSCVEILCPPLNVTEHGEIVKKPLNFHALTKVHFRCSDGYRPDGVSELTCMPDGTWDGDPPICQPINCGNLPNVKHGFMRGGFDGNNMSAGQNVSFACEPGYFLNGSKELKCSPNEKWIGEIPHCELIDCGSPVPIANAIVITNGRLANYSCNDGYTMSNASSGQMRCGESGMWEEHFGTPVCVSVSCKIPQGIRFGAVTVGSISPGSVANYSCKQGYEIVGDSVRTCLNTGNWSGNHPKCFETKCPTPNIILNGNVSGGGPYVPGITVRYVCDLGYHHRGPSQRTCLSSGQWSHPAPVCTRIVCPMPEPIFNGFSHGSKYDYGSVILSTCSEGYRLEGNIDARVCIANGTWSGSEPLCSKVTCESVDNLKNGKIFFYSFHYQSRIFYQCDVGFKLVGPDRRTCLSNESWSDWEPRCEAVQCSDRLNGPPLNGAVTVSNGMIDYKCDDGYVLVGESRRRCDSLEQTFLIGNPPVECVPVNCTVPNSPSHGFVTVPHLRYGSTAEYGCSLGFKLVGSAVRTCLKDGYWSDDNPSCQHVECPKADQLRNYRVVGDGHLMGAIVQFDCDVGYHLLGSNSLTCRETGKWSSDWPTCVIVTCVWPLSPPTNGLVNSTGHRYKDVANYSCDPEFRMVGGHQKVCLLNGSWSGSALPPQCVPVQCDVPEQPQHGQALLFHNGHSYGNVITYECNHGYLLVGQSTRKCLLDGKWTGVDPFCEPMNCENPRDIPNGSFNVSGFTLGAVAKYRCDSGYVMDEKESGILECVNPGRWMGATFDGRLPQCLRIRCTSDYPPVLLNGRALDSGNEFGVSLEFACDDGFSLIGESIVRCNESGQWSTRFPVCAIVTCPPPPKLSKGHVFPQECLAHGFKVTYECDVGFALVGSVDRTCTKAGTWSGTPPKCLPITCQHPGNIQNGISSPSTTSNLAFFYGDNVTYECDEGFNIDRSFGERTQIRCLETGKWNHEPPECLRITCPRPAEEGAYGTILNANSTDDFTVGTVLNYSCKIGYVIERQSSNDIIECLADGQWSKPQPRCSPVSCGRPAEIDNGRVTYDSIVFNGIARYECETGHRFAEREHVHQIRTCAHDGIWSPSETPQCAMITCSALAFDAVGGRLHVLQGAGTSHGTVVSYECYFEFHLVGSEMRTCLADGTWSGVEALCESNQCPLPKNVTNGTFELDSTLVGGTVVFGCFRGFELFGESVLTCMFDGNWSGIQPLCRRITCPELNEISFGVISLDGHQMDSRARYACNDGYELSGGSENDDGRRQCIESGKWSGLEPKCVQVVCPTPAEPISNGILEMSKSGVHRVGDVVRYVCDEGARMNGESIRTCMNDRSWSGAAPKCEMVSCPPLLNLENGRTTMEGRSEYNTTAKFVCSPLHDLRGSETLRCLSSGRWNDTPPVCVRVGCDRSPAIANTAPVHGEPRTHLINDTVDYVCREGFVASASSERLRCSEGGHWQGERLLCSPVECGPSPDVLDAAVSLTVPPEQGLNTYGTVARYACPEGFDTIGNVDMVCGADGLWKGDVPQCRKLACGPPALPFPARTYVRMENYEHLSRAMYYCEEGYTIVNASTVFQCLESGHWNIDLLSLESSSCVPVVCGEPTEIHQGTVNFTGIKYGDVAYYACPIGYRLTGGTARIVCGAKGQWVGQRPRCQLVTCPPPDIPSNGLVQTGGEFRYGLTIAYGCRLGYRLIGNAVRRCGHDGIWNGRIPPCILIQCAEPIPPVHGYVMVDDRKLGDEARFICEDGYELLGENVTRCGPNAEWTTPTPICSAVKCHSPPLPLNALFRRPLLDTYSSGEQVTFGCASGHISSSKMIIWCLPNGTWTELRGRCKGWLRIMGEGVDLKPHYNFTSLAGKRNLNLYVSKVNCGRPHALNGAIVFGTLFRYGDRAVYSCPPSRKGSGILRCQEDGHWDSEAICEGILCRTPCLNGGICMDRDRCHCPAGFVGHHCESAVCILPCLNGGTCVRPYRCLCQLGFVGSRCHIPTCDPPCRNGGQCIRPNICQISQR